MMEHPDWLIIDLHRHLTQTVSRRAMRRTFGHYSLSGLYSFFDGKLPPLTRETAQGMMLRAALYDDPSYVPTDLPSPIAEYRAKLQERDGR